MINTVLNLMMGYSVRTVNSDVNIVSFWIMLKVSV